MSRTSEQVEALAKTELLRGLTETDLLRVAATAHEQTFADGVVIAAEGATDGDFYLILDGHVHIEIGGKREEELGPGDYFGEMAIIDGEPRSASVISDGETRVLSVGRWSFRSLVREHADIAEALLIEMTRRLRLARAARTY